MEVHRAKRVSRCTLLQILLPYNVFIGVEGVIAVRDSWSKVYQFKITLTDTEPPIWRQIMVPSNYTFWDLHVAIQDSMGWLDSHLHSFAIADPSTGERFEVGIPESTFVDEEDILPDWKYKIADYFSMSNREAVYVYDFGDYWVHDITLERILDSEAGVSYPSLIDGKRACPPEDCGGVYGYAELLEALSDPSSEEYKEMVEWLGEVYDPERFDPAKVQFSDPDRRLRSILRGS